MNNQSPKAYHYIRLRNRSGCPKIEHFEKNHKQPKIIENQVETNVIRAFSMDLQHIEKEDYNQREDIVYQRKGFCCTCHQIQAKDYKQRIEYQLKLLVFLSYFYYCRIIFLDLLCLHSNGSTIKISCTVLIAFLLFLGFLLFALPSLAFFILFIFVLLSTFLTTLNRINSFFDKIDDVEYTE